MDHPDVLARLAVAACDGGGIGIRAEGIDNLRAIKAAVDVPVIGLIKREVPGYSVRITPALEDIYAVAEVGCDAVALDATFRDRPGDHDAQSLIAKACFDLEIPVLADIDTFDAGIRAADAGADAVATTLSGYTAETAGSSEGPDLDLVRELSRRVSVPVFAEGRFHDTELARSAIRLGARAVVVGTAITATTWITEQFAIAVNEPAKDQN